MITSEEHVALTDFHIQGYRSVRDVWLRLNNINVIVGPNGSGKSNLYRAVYLLSAAASGQLAKALATEGGMPSILWAGPRAKKEPAAMQLSVRLDNFRYNLVCGMAGDVIRPAVFMKDPVITREEVFLLRGNQKSNLLKRSKQMITARTAQGSRIDYTMNVPFNESVLTGLRDPQKFPELYSLRQEFLNWRFYHHFRTDMTSPLRKPQLAVFTPVLSQDAQDLASALATIQSAGNSDLLDEMIQRAFPGATLYVREVRGGLQVYMSASEFGRPFAATELSDGTLQYLCLLAALLSLHAPPLMALNEPEASLHPHLLEPLARLIVAASSDTQIWLTTHSQELADLIMDLSGYDPFKLEKIHGETKLVGRGLGGYKHDDELDSDDDDAESGCDDESGSDDESDDNEES
jgi:predicted ATPase